MIKKYEIINDKGNKRVRALRSWRVQDRYVNIGDVGGIVYDEKTLSQDGACWLFRGNFNFPGARIGGDSIVDVGEAAPDASGSANLDILGTSTVVGAPVKFTAGLGAVSGKKLTEADFEQGALDYLAGTNWETWKTNSTNYLRTKAPIFMGGVSATLSVQVPGYSVRAYVLDRDGIGIAVTTPVDTGAGATLTVPGGQYYLLRLSKNPPGGIVPADATAAQIKTTAVFDTKLVVVDSRLELNQANGAIAIRSGGPHSLTPGAKCPDSIIQGSKVVINSRASQARMVRVLAELVNVSATIDATTEDAQVVGIYHGVYNLAFTGNVTSSWDEAARSLIQAYNCDNMVVNTTNFPGLAGMQTAGVPIRFYNCNLIEGRFYHHAQIANTYRDINFDLATKDLGKTFSTDRTLGSSEVNGMYRAIFNGIPGPLIESYASVKDLVVAQNQKMYDTTIYRDAYFKGKFEFAGTNVFGNKVPGHPRARVLNVQSRAVQGDFNTVSPGDTITSATGVAGRVCVLEAFRINGPTGILVSGAPKGIEVSVVFVSATNTIVTALGWASTPWTPASAELAYKAAYLRFRKSDDSPITPEDLAGVTVTVYNGCKIINTGATAVNMKGNIRVEDNATLVNASVTGSGYFGGNSVVYYNPAVWASLDFVGAVFMKDKTVFAPKALTGACALVHMEGNAKFIGSVDVASTNLSFIMRDNAVMEGKANTRSGVVMSGNSKVAAAGQIMAASRGVLVMEENASIEASTTVIGAITLSGNYKGNEVKTWTGKRTITDVNAPEYDDNVKTEYDF